MIDRLRLSGLARCFGKTFFVRESIDQTAFAHVTSADKSHFWIFLWWTFINRNTGGYKFGGSNLHHYLISSFSA
jgi:hypothetical protein